MRAVSQDLRRIKTQGPRLEDVTQTRTADLKKEDGTTREYEYKWVPKEVITSSGQYVTKEPDWQHLPQMPYMEFYNVSLLSHHLHNQLCYIERPSTGATSTYAQQSAIPCIDSC